MACANARAMRLRFIKCHGSGNDFPLIDARGLDLREDDWPRLARVLADRAGPVGGDGMLLLTDAGAPDSIGFRMFNSDGSEAETCLNGVRCVARAGLEGSGRERATVRLIGSTAKVARADDIAPGVYTIEERAGPALLNAAAFPIHGEGERVIDRQLARLPSARAFTAVAIPNPHLVAFVDAVDEGELVEVGLACEAAPDWLPNRANVSFVEVRAPDTIFVRTHERGVGLTNSCGSAMAASTFAAGVTGRVPFGTTVTVLNRGGLVRARAAADGTVTIHGNATWEWEGDVEVDLVRETASGLRVLRQFDDEVAAWSRAVAQ